MRWAASLAVNMRVGVRTGVGFGAAVIHKIQIRADKLIGAGAVVVFNQPGGVVAYGNPCKISHKRSAFDQYL